MAFCQTFLKTAGLDLDRILVVDLEAHYLWFLFLFFALKLF